LILVLFHQLLNLWIQILEVRLFHPVDQPREGIGMFLIPVDLGNLPFLELQDVILSVFLIDGEVTEGFFLIGIRHRLDDLAEFFWRK
jgi:hypothetical protein